MPYLLEPVGLGRGDNDVYLALVAHPSASAPALAEATSLPVDAVEASLQRLADAGLAVRDLHDGPRYRAISPDEAVPPLIARRRQELVDLQRSVDAMAAAGRTTGGAREAVAERIPPADLVDVVMGLQGGAREELLIVAAPPSLDGGVWPNDGELAALARGVTYRVVYHPASLVSPEAMAHVRHCVEAGEDARILAGAGPKMVIVDRSLAVVVESMADPDPSARLLVRPSTLLDLLVARFEQQWEAAVPVDAPSEGAPGEVSERDRELLALLAAGLKDRAIAHTLGVTERTIGRRVTDLMERLDAPTRFRAGARAAQRGWIPPD